MDNSWEMSDEDARRFCPITEGTETFIKDEIECEMDKGLYSKEEIIEFFCQENKKDDFAKNKAAFPCKHKGLSRAVQPPPPSPYVSF